MIRALELTAAAVVVASIAQPLAAQGSIRAGNVDYAVQSIPNSIDSGAGTALFTAKRNQTANIIRRHWWYYRIDADPREYPLNTGDTNNDGTNTQGFVETYNGDRALLAWTDVDERGLLTAVWTIRVLSTGPNRGTAVSRLMLTNRSNATLRLNVFAFNRLWMCFDHMNITGTPDRWHILPDPGNCIFPNIFGEFVSINPDHYELANIDMGNELRLRLIDNQITNLNDTGIPMGVIPHFDGGVQWQDRSLYPGQSETFTVLFSHNYSPCNQEATAVPYGQGSLGTNGVPTLLGVNPPIIGIGRPAGLDTFPKMRIANGLANGNGALIAGLTRANVQVGNVTLLTNSIADIPIALDATGANDVVLQIPDIPSLCGFKFDFQALLLDPGAAGLFPVAHTGGLEWTLGGY
jgi:hypothetical protein